MSGMAQEDGAARIAMAMSGGVDSSVAALLLRRQGASLVGISLHLTDVSGGGRCCSPRDFLDARMVAEKLDFPYYVLNMEREFRAAVIEDFIREYRSGRTPLPCAHCNTQVKFGDLLKRAELLGCGRVATGHYARLSWDGAAGRTRLWRARDREKDQSYFLFGLEDRQRDRALFPLGDLSKGAVRTLAREAGLAVADKPESMDLCFLPGGGHGVLVERETGLASETAGGDFLDRDGKILGRHRGVHHYTVGQRRGLGVSGPEPYYVVEIRASDNSVVLGTAQEQLRRECHVPRPNWIGVRPPGSPLEALVQIRHRHPGGAATLAPDPAGGVRVRFCDPQRAIAPGQAAVFYRDDEVLGGGFIAAAH